jgi:hypothetical protein
MSCAQCGADVLPQGSTCDAYRLRRLPSMRPDPDAVWHEVLARAPQGSALVDHIAGPFR